MPITTTEPGLFISKFACTSGTESAPTSATDGFSLTTAGGVFSLAVEVQANDGVTNLTAGSTLQAFFYQPQTSTWARCNGTLMDLTLDGGTTKEVFPAVNVQPYGRIAYVPNGVGTAVNIYVFGAQKRP